MKNWLKKFPIKRHRIVIDIMEEDKLLGLLHHIIPRQFPSIIFVTDHVNTVEGYPDYTKHCIRFNCTNAQWRVISINIKYGFYKSATILDKF